jgi:heme-degrading monooxygenase HmoA
MHIQIINFNLKDLSEEDYQAAGEEQFAPAFADVPGLISKVWLANSETNTYGGVYTWRDRRAMVEFTKSELFNAVISNPNLANLVSTDFSVMENPTRTTRGFVEVSV